MHSVPSVIIRNHKRPEKSILLRYELTKKHIIVYAPIRTRVDKQMILR